MFIIPGILISIATFPGVIVHEAAHMLACKLCKVAVLDVCFFRAENPAGYVIYEGANSFGKAFLISMGPFALNSLLCVLICFPAYLPIQVFHLTHPVSYFLMWLGVSIGMHAFPSSQDAKILLEYAKQGAKRYHPLAILSLPLVILIYAANLLTVIWFDLLYGIGLGVWLPSLLFKLA